MGHIVSIHEILWCPYWECLLSYPLKVESPCNIVAWWIITIDSLMSWFTIGPIQCVSYALIHSPWENHPDSQDKLSTQLGGTVLQSHMDNSNPWTNCRQLITLQRTHDFDLMCNSLCTQVIYNVNDIGLVCLNNQLIQMRYLRETKKHK